MDYVGIVLFAIVLYVRPQEFIGLLDAFRPALSSLALAGVGLFVRPGGVSPKQLIRTPMDWLMMAYFIYILFWTPGAIGDLWKRLYPFIGFYLLVVMTLTSIRRIYTYLAWLCGAIMFVAIMALLSLVGFDPLGSQATTAGSLGRLTLNTSLFSNPNALGHSVMVAVPFLYFFMFWRRPIFVKEVGAPLIFLPLLCTYFTESKGAFISGAGAIVATLAFGRPKWVQFILLPILLVGATSAVPLLPRFGQVKFGGGQARNDEAVLGRIQAFEFGKEALERNRFGLGYGQFEVAFIRKVGELKARASHCSYNQIGAELGWWGLLLFSGILYAGFHSLMRARTADDNEERVRRILFCALLSFAVSSWMIDFGFRAIFFVTVAMISAFHRILMDRSPSYAPETDEANREEWGGVIGIKETRLVDTGAAVEAPTVANAQDYLLQRKVVRGVPTRPRQFLAAQTGVASTRDEPQRPAGYVPPIKDDGNLPPELAGAGVFMPWPRFRWYDIAGVYLSLRLVLYIRDYAISL
ncbi:MAG: O-antigen ligase family protein [Verrucomicrobia bacterium]|nr:O-antigen ligase family protein [Verrucomicrobiota bacterium]